MARRKGGGSRYVRDANGRFASIGYTGQTGGTGSRLKSPGSTAKRKPAAGSGKQSTVRNAPARPGTVRRPAGMGKAPSRSAAAKPARSAAPKSTVKPAAKPARSTVKAAPKAGSAAAVKKANSASVGKPKVTAAKPKTTAKKAATKTEKSAAKATKPAQTKGGALATRGGPIQASSKKAASDGKKSSKRKGKNPNAGKSPEDFGAVNSTARGLPKVNAANQMRAAASKRPSSIKKPDAKAKKPEVKPFSTLGGRFNIPTAKQQEFANTYRKKMDKNLKKKNRSHKDYQEFTSLSKAYDMATDGYSKRQIDSYLSQRRGKQARTDFRQQRGAKISDKLRNKRETRNMSPDNPKFDHGRYWGESAKSQERMSRRIYVSTKNHNKRMYEANKQTLGEKEAKKIFDREQRKARREYNYDRKTAQQQREFGRQQTAYDDAFASSSRPARPKVSNRTVKGKAENDFRNAVDGNSSPATVRKAYLKAMQKNHPDAGGTEAAAKRINAEYEEWKGGRG